MSGARLKALRLVGFKSFADKTLVEFGPGISAVVGPNGSGKSNLADALRWVFGEQGRSLRTRRSEDVIFAGSAGRRAIGMADVTLVVDNEDRLLPLDYGEVELGRRLFRSGENEYLINRQRARLRDLSELLDAANLSDNAFLFIGQGMVDQALSLRPEERRPLFEEAAGVRRHERRRRAAEAQLAEAESNLARVRDILAELRPQARRLAAQVEQEAARRAAADELAAELVAAARVRWLAAEAAASGAAADRARADEQRRAHEARRREFESEVARLTAALADDAAGEAGRRATLEAARNRTTELRLREERLAADEAALGRERERLERERSAAEVRREEAQRTLATVAGGQLDGGDERLAQLSRELAGVEREQSEAAAELGRLRAARRASGERRAALERALAEQAAEQEARHQAAAAAARRLAEQREREERSRRELVAAEAAREEAAQRLLGASNARAAAEDRADAARAATLAAEGLMEGRHGRAVELEAGVARLQARLDLLEDRLAAADSAVRSPYRGRGTPLLDGLEVAPDLRLAVEVALGAALGAVAVPTAVVRALADRSEEPAPPGGRATVVLVEPAEASPGRSAGTAIDPLLSREARAAAAALGGGALDEALRGDRLGLGRRLLATALWVPDLASALALRGQLPTGWCAVSRDGWSVTAQGLVTSPGDGTEPLLALREERARLRVELERSRSGAAEARTDADRSRAELEERRREADRAGASLEAARAAARGAEDAERAAARTTEAAAREAAWERAQLDRLQRVAEEAAADASGSTQHRLHADVPGDRSLDEPELAPLDERVRALADRRDRLAAQIASARAAQRAAEERRQRAATILSLEAIHLTELDAELERPGRDIGRVRDEREPLARALARARESERQEMTALEASTARSAGDRARLEEAERAATHTREATHAAEERIRAAELAETEARLQLAAQREALLLELGGLGRTGLAALASPTVPSTAPPPPDEPEDERETEGASEEFETALDRTLTAWRSAGEGATDTPAPSPGRLSALRRRFHQLGGGGPFAAEEYEEVRGRLSELERQRDDLETAMASTRRLIAELGVLIAQRFRSTFAALETAFGRQFAELFGGGEAQLSLTDPEDLAATGVEITARPPGKKRQALAMLSGGERALTAVALLFAMLEVRPVPFCVLDEVDAALDEANIGRFAAALRGLAEGTQFIVITHNRGTIESADALYGVTVGDDAVSRVISLRLTAAALEEPSGTQPFFTSPPVPVGPGRD